MIRSGRPLPAALAGSMAAGLVAAAAKKSFLQEVAGAGACHFVPICCLAGSPGAVGGSILRVVRPSAALQAWLCAAAACQAPAELPRCASLPLPAGAVLLELCSAVDNATLAGLVEGGSAPLAPWLTAPAADASPEALLLALRLWPRLPAAAAAACPLLPGGFKAKQLPAALFTDPAAAAGSKAVAAAAAAFFTKQHLGALLPVLRGTTAAHPRLHSVWPTLLALLIPGFSADKVRQGRPVGASGPQVRQHCWPCRMAAAGCAAPCLATHDSLLRPAAAPQRCLRSAPHRCHSCSPFCPAPCRSSATRAAVRRSRAPQPRRWRLFGRQWWKGTWWV